MKNPGNSWKRYQKGYVGQAANATAETVAQTQLTSGGYGASYANNAAGQAQDNYLAGLYDRFSSIYNTTDKSKNKGRLSENGLWQNYADQYARQGRQAMRDTLGQYEAQTGGYGNSLATGAAAQAYYNYLDQAMAKWPTRKPGGGGRGRKNEEDPWNDSYTDDPLKHNLTSDSPFKPKTAAPSPNINWKPGR